MSILNAVGQIGHEMPPEHWLKLQPKGKGLQNKKSCPLSSSMRIKSLATVVADLQYTLKGIQGKDQDEVLGALRKMTELTLREILYLLEKYFILAPSHT